jgi:hypothetical protein
MDQDALLDSRLVFRSASLITTFKYMGKSPYSMIPELHARREMTAASVGTIALAAASNRVVWNPIYFANRT